MAMEPTRSKTRFERRKIEIPLDQAPSPQMAAGPAPHGGTSPVVWFLLVTVSVLLGVVGFGYSQLQGQAGTLRPSLAQNVDLPSSEPDALAAASAEIAQLKASLAALPANDGDTRLRDERDAAMSSLANARQRIAALQAELGAPATGQIEIGQQPTFDAETGTSQQLDALLLEIRLLARERDAAREQIDRMLKEEETAEAPAVVDNSAELLELRYELENLREANEKLEAELAERDARLQAREGELTDVEKAIEALEADKEASQELEQERQSQLEAAEAELASLQDSLSAAEEATAASLDEQTAQVVGLTTRLDELDRQLEQTRADMEIVEAERDDARLRIAELEEQRRDAQIKSEASNDAMETLGLELQALERVALENTELKDANATLNQALTTAEAQVTDLSEVQKALEAEIETLKLAQRDGSQQAETSRAQLASNDAKFEELQAELAGLQSALDAAEARNSVLVGELADAKSNAQTLAAALEVAQQRQEGEPAAVSVDSDLEAQLTEFRDRQAFLERVLRRYTPQPPPPAPR